MARSCRCAKRLVSNSQSPCHDRNQALCPRNRGRIPVGPQGTGAARTGVCSKNEQDRPVVCNDVAAGLIRPSLLFARHSYEDRGRTRADHRSERQNPCPHCTCSAGMLLADHLGLGGTATVVETVAAIVEVHRSGATSPEATVARTYARIRAHRDPAVFISLREEAQAIAEAKALAARGERDLPLYGVPLAVKDNIDVKGPPTPAACPAFSSEPGKDATCVARLRAAGAIVIGKTNLDQFATGLVGVRTPYGIPRNLFDPALIPGGSSSGSAIAVAAGLVPLALGTDTAGSGRVPAGLSNIVGLKPSLGLVSTAGVVPACRTLDCVSPPALTP